jgi:hypothetical protein
VIVFAETPDSNYHLLASPDFDVVVCLHGQSVSSLPYLKYAAVQFVFMGTRESDIDAIHDSLPDDLPAIIRCVRVLREAYETPSFWLFEHEIVVHGDAPPVDFLLARVRPRIRELVAHKTGLR